MIRKQVLSSANRLSLMITLVVVAVSGPSFGQGAPQDPKPVQQNAQTAEVLNQRLEQLRLSLTPRDSSGRTADYAIGPEDLLEISVFEAPELNRSVRVSAGGEISLTLLGPVQAAGLTPRQLEFVLQELLRRSFMKDPHVGVFVREMQSHAVSVFGAVRKPGVVQIRGPRSLVEILSMAEGLAEDAGDTVLVIRGGGLDRPGPVSPANDATATVKPVPTETTANAQAVSSTTTPAGSLVSLEIDLKQLLESADPQANVPVYPGDLVKVSRAGVVYVVGEVHKPGGFLLKNNENISALQAIALAEGLTRTSAKEHARIIRNDAQTGRRTEIPLPLGKVLSGKSPDLALRPNDIVFVPNSAARSGFYRGAEAAVSIVTGLIILRR